MVFNFLKMMGFKESNKSDEFVVPIHNELLDKIIKEIGESPIINEQNIK